MTTKFTFITETEQDFSEFLSSLETIIEKGIEMTDYQHKTSDVSPTIYQADTTTFTYETPVILFSITK